MTTKPTTRTTAPAPARAPVQPAAAPKAATKPKAKEAAPFDSKRTHAQDAADLQAAADELQRQADAEAAGEVANEEPTDEQEGEVSSEQTEPTFMDDVAEDLFPDAASAAEAEEIWSEGGALAAQGRPVGKFLATFLEATLNRSASSDRLQISYKLEIVTPGEHQGAEVTKYDGLGSAQQAQITRSQLERVGIAGEHVTLRALPALLLPLIGRTAEIQCKQNGAYYNVYFQRLLPAQRVGG